MIKKMLIFVGVIFSIFGVCSIKSYAFEGYVPQERMYTSYYNLNKIVFSAEIGNTLAFDIENETLTGDTILSNRVVSDRQILTHSGTTNMFSISAEYLIEPTFNDFAVCEYQGKGDKPLDIYEKASVYFENFYLNIYDHTGMPSQPHNHCMIDIGEQSEEEYQVNGTFLRPSIIDDVVQITPVSFEFTTFDSFYMYEVYDYLVDEYGALVNGYWVQELVVTCSLNGSSMIYAKVPYGANLSANLEPSSFAPFTSFDTWFNNLDLTVDIEYDYTSWLITAVGGFMAFEIIPGFSIGGIFSVAIMIALLSYILKMFLGG